MVNVAAMAELLIYHHEKRNKNGKLIAPEVSYPADDERVRLAPAAALTRLLARAACYRDRPCRLAG